MGAMENMCDSGGGQQRRNRGDVCFQRLCVAALGKSTAGSEGVGTFTSIGPADLDEELPTMMLTEGTLPPTVDQKLSFSLAVAEQVRRRAALAPLTPLL